jgi:hypothetical protein
MWPQDVIENTIKAYSTSATSLTGYGASGAPSGRYFAPPNGPDCIELDPGADFGSCGTGSLVVTGPMFKQFDIAVSKRITLFGRSNLELRVEALNAFNNVNFEPEDGIGGDAFNDYEVGGFLGQNAARVVQFIGRINW